LYQNYDDVMMHNLSNYDDVMMHNLSNYDDVLVTGMHNLSQRCGYMVGAFSYKNGSLGLILS